jgi:hypothetical protein
MSFNASIILKAYSILCENGNYLAQENSGHLALEPLVLYGGGGYTTGSLLSISATQSSLYLVQSGSSLDIVATE